MSRNLYLGVDLGTSYFKLGLFDEMFRLKGLGRVAVPNSGDGSITSEVSAEDFRAALSTGLAAALADAGETPDCIKAVSWSSQANSFLLLDEFGVPLTPFLLWNDRRVESVDEAVAAVGNLPDFAAVTGCGGKPSVCSAISKIMWLRTNRPEIWAKTRGIATIADYLGFVLSGERKIDGGTAVLLAIFDQCNKTWWHDAIVRLGINEELLPKPVRPGTAIGRVTDSGADFLGAPGLAGATVTAGTLDHCAAAIGAGLGDTADVSESTGTVLACVRLTDTYRPVPTVTILPGCTDGTYNLLAYDENGAGILEWYHNNFAANVSFAELDALAGDVPVDCGGLVMSDSPQLRVGLSGFSGSTIGMGHGYYARAIMSAVSDKLGVLLERLCVPRSERIVATGGGARSPFWLQLKHDRLGITIFPADCPEPACRGAAILAHYGIL